MSSNSGGECAGILSYGADLEGFNGVLGDREISEEEGGGGGGSSDGEESFCGETKRGIGL